MKSIKKILLVSRIYSIPILVLLAGFGLYYTIFEAVHEFEDELNSPYVQELIQYQDADTNMEANDLLGQASADPHELPITQASQQSQFSNSPQDTIINTSTTPSIKTTTPQIQDTPEQAITSHLYLINAQTLNVRQAPHTNSPIVARFFQGDQVIVTEEQGDWLKTKEGWVAKNFLIRIDYNQEKPIFYEVTLKVINVRQDPNLNSPIITKKRKGSVVVPLEEKFGWIRISEGWVYKSLLRKVES